MKRFALFLSLFLTFSSVAQKRRPLPGKVTINEVPAEDGEVKVTNLSSGEKTATSPGGFYTLNVRKGDTLQYKGVELRTRNLLITAFDVDVETLLVDLKRNGTELPEVKVDGSRITSESLGIPVGKEYTPAERRLENATTVKPQRDPDKAYTAVGTDGAINAISGRTAQLKKEAIVEKKLMWKQKLSERYDARYYTDTLQVPREHVDGFLYYSVDNKKFLKALETENEEQIRLQLTALAVDYRKTLKSERK